MSKPVTFPCPHCKKPSLWHDNPSRPFCSERCKLIDLGAWANEDYKIASPTAPELTEHQSEDDLND
ncbi:DNA gyrase inhibitor YacG [Alkanindiges hydrocarboniclasticus]|jgi:endogenous inhibitor of DNA gyrase (YacG/DUF329 family)|uniref:DNA gyrase inhibitor YacG n=1 Tax=Alkanindiges hydrocarboniclasticus TaxID=1907941 RepID=A0A1S8CSS4_9GAMM|nr:DNA gyrase inhibitor YacG [Alkanindiges hydrocarboniclasticus]ONG38689.1 DNA gyrase inhibitor YacG [Alkanindiges hydrocarboniclasticus]